MMAWKIVKQYFSLPSWWGMLSRVCLVIEYRMKHLTYFQKYNRSKQMILRYTEAWISPTVMDWVPDDA